MSKSLFIAEKPSVAQEFIKALGDNPARRDGYSESDNAVFTWCVGHLITMSYPAEYNPELKRWSMDTLPFIPTEWKYEVIPGVAKQYNIVSGLLNRDDIDKIYVCTDSGREGEYIYRLVEQMSGVKGKKRLRVWIDSQTEEEILRGVKEAKDLSEYDSLSDSAYLRAKEDYLMGINFSRALTLKYGNAISSFFRSNDRTVIAVGRVMTCVLGMIVRREREIREFVKTPFYRVTADAGFDAEWKVTEKSAYYNSPYLYKENGFREKTKAEELVNSLKSSGSMTMEVVSVERKKEKKQPPLLYNLAELQNDCSRIFKLSPDETLKHTQELYEKKLVTYPRTDARVLSTAVAKVIDRNITGLSRLAEYEPFVSEILEKKSYQGIARTRYVNDRQITDHYAIIPTGQGFGNMKSLSRTSLNVYHAIVRKFLGIFYPAAVYTKTSVELQNGNESFFAGFKVLEDEGWLKVSGNQKKEDDGENTDNGVDASVSQMIKKIKKNDIIPVREYNVKEGETTPPKRYNSGTLILAMENAGQLIEDPELRAQIKGSGIGTSATRAEILKKLVDKKYVNLNGKTQIITPSQLGEMVYDIVDNSIKRLLDPRLTASWEKGLTGVADGSISTGEYLEKLESFISKNTSMVKVLDNVASMRRYFELSAPYYVKK